jgi:hypothetical protein
MGTLAILTLAVLLGLGVAGAEAGDATGKIQSVDTTERVIVLDDGTTLWIAEGLSMESLREGTRVTASYEERDGRNVATLVEVED